MKITDLIHTLNATRAALLAASDGDGIVSRNDLKLLLGRTEDPMEGRFLEFFYDFLRKLEDRPRMRVTEDVIDRGIAYIQDQIIPQFEIEESFSQSTNQEIARLHKSALPMAMELIRFTTHNVTLNPREVSEQIAPLTEGLFFDDYGSEAVMSIESFFLEHPPQELSPTSFAEALGIDPTTPKGKIERFDSADRVLLTFVEQHVWSGNADQAQAVVDLMNENLTDHTIIVVGQDNHPDLESNHPVYVVGMGGNGNLAGFTSFVIWT